MNLKMRKTSPLLLLFVLCPTFAMNDHCRNRTFDRPTNGEPLHFSKENSDQEFGIYDKFKCLHCCSHGYRSIEWFKNGQPYPWPTDVSTLIIHPDSSNQTVCSQQTSAIDSGTYWCIARNVTHSLRHQVLLQISGPSISMGWPKTTYRPRNQKADCGESVRFYCEAFVGTIDLPDFQSEITWVRGDLNESFIDGARVVQEAVFREEKRILGSYLYFKRVTPEDYGEYTCKVRNLGDQVLKLSAWLSGKDEASSTTEDNCLPCWVYDFLFYVLILMLFVITVCFVRFLLSRASGKHASQEFVDDGKKDVLVICHKKDKQKAAKTITILKGAHFRSFRLHPLESAYQLGEEQLRGKANSYKEVLALLSPRLTEGTWTCAGVHPLIQSILDVHFSVTCVFCQAIPKPKNDSTEWQLLNETLNKIRYVDLSENWSLRFFSALPPRKKNSAMKGSSQNLI